MKRAPCSVRCLDNRIMILWEFLDVREISDCLVHLWIREQGELHSQEKQDGKMMKLGAFT